MIQLVEKEKERQKLLKACEKTPFGCKITAIAASYGFDKSFACFWMDPETDVAFCMVDGQMILSGTVLKGKETAEFLRAVGPESVFCAVRNAEELGLKAIATGDVLKKQLEPGEEKAAVEHDVNIREIYGLLEETGMVEEFEPFYLDISHKLRHGMAVAFTEYSGSVLQGCALASVASESAVILTAVAVREDCRRQGVGTDLVRRVENRFPGRTVYLFREKEKNREFYKKLGYGKSDTWVHARRP